MRLTYGGLCERPKLVKDFDPDRYVGRWYEFYRSYSVGFETEDCATATYVKLPRNYIQVNNVEYELDNQRFKNGVDYTRPGRAQCSSFFSGKCQVEFF